MKVTVQFNVDIPEDSATLPMVSDWLKFELGCTDSLPKGNDLLEWKLSQCNISKLFISTPNE